MLVCSSASGSAGGAGGATAGTLTLRNSGNDGTLDALEQVIKTAKPADLCLWWLQEQWKGRQAISPQSVARVGREVVEGVVRLRNSKPVRVNFNNPPQTPAIKNKHAELTGVVS